MKEKWTVRDIAERCQCSKPTVRTTAKSLGLEPIEKEKNRVLYSQESADSIFFAIVSKSKKELHKSENGKEVENEKNRTESAESGDNRLFQAESESENKSENKSESKMENGKYEDFPFWERELEFLREQIKIKDEQIKSQALLLENLQTENKNLSAKNDIITAKLLGLESITIDTSKDRPIAEEQQEKEKKGLFSWFRRKV